MKYAKMVKKAKEALAKGKPLKLSTDKGISIDELRNFSRDLGVDDVIISVKKEKFVLCFIKKESEDKDETVVLREDIGVGTGIDLTQSKNLLQEIEENEFDKGTRMVDENLFENPPSEQEALEEPVKKHKKRKGKR